MSGVAPRTEKVELEALRDAIRAEYGAVAIDPEAGYHFNAGRDLAATLDTNPSGWKGSLRNL